MCEVTIANRAGWWGSRRRPGGLPINRVFREPRRTRNPLEEEAYGWQAMRLEQRPPHVLVKVHPFLTDAQGKPRVERIITLAKTHEDSAIVRIVPPHRVTGEHAAQIGAPLAVGGQHVLCECLNRFHEIGRAEFSHDVRGFAELAQEQRHYGVEQEKLDGVAVDLDQTVLHLDAHARGR